MCMFLCFVANRDEGVAGTLHVVVAEGNYCSTWRAFSQLFYVIPLMLTVYAVLNHILLSPPTLFVHPGSHVNTFLRLLIFFTFHNTTFITIPHFSVS